MPDNSLAPPNMPWLWQPNSPVGQPNGLGPPMLNYAAPPNPAAPTVGQGVAQTAADVAQAWPSVEEQRRMLQPLPGWQGTAVDAAKQWAEGVMMGTTAPGDVPPPGIVAYHGSPHSFDQFDTSKIGTGEGNQSYGHGLYFGEESTARTYKEGLGKPAIQIGDQKIVPDRGSPEDIALAHLETAFDNQSSAPYAQAYQSLLRAHAVTPETPTNTARNTMQAAMDKLADWQEQGATPTTAGHMYQVSIGADPEHFLDWDKPLSEQSQHVQEALGKVPWTEPYLQSGKFAGSQIAPKTPEGAQQLKDAGVAGIRYLDQGSRGASQGTHNYVVFDAATIDILRKYGLAGLIAGGGAAAAGTQQQQPSQ